MIRDEELINAIEKCGKVIEFLEKREGFQPARDELLACKEILETELILLRRDRINCQCNVDKALATISRIIFIAKTVFSFWL